MLEFNSGIISSELPVHAFLPCIPIRMPLIKFIIQIFQIVNSPFAQALFCQCS